MDSTNSLEQIKQNILALERNCEQRPWQLCLLLSAYYKMANAEFRLDHIEDSLQYYEKIQSFSPHYAEIHLNKALVLLTLSDLVYDAEEGKKLLVRAKAEAQAQLEYDWHNNGTRRAQDALKAIVQKSGKQ